MFVTKTVHLLVLQQLNLFLIISCRGGCDFNKVQDEWQALKVIVANTFSDKSYLALWQTLLTKEPYNHDFEVCH